MSRASFRGAVIAAILLLGGCLIAVGQQISSTEVIGGSGGSSFSDSQLQSGALIVEVHIRCGDLVDSVQMTYAGTDGRTFTGPRHGGSGGRDKVFRLDQDEYIIGLSGRYGDAIDSIRIHTNRRVSQLFGGGGGKREYRIEVPNGYQAVGFSGQAGKVIDAIGLTYTSARSTRRGGFFSGNPPPPQPPQQQPQPPRSPSGSGAISGPGGASWQISQTSIAGGGGGSYFSDRDVPSGARITGIRVHAAAWIDGIQAVYLLPNGRSADGLRHGGSGGREGFFRLDSDEYIIGISGRYGGHVDSLVLHTNKRTSRQYGGRGGDRDYRIEVPMRSQAVGFAGRAGGYLDAIGLTYATMSQNDPPQRPRRY